MLDEENPYTRPLVIRGGVLVIDGYGIRVHVRRGRLVVDDGVGPWRRSVELSRATSGLRRLVVLGQAGSITLDAIRWLHGVGASLVHIDRDGTPLVETAARGTDIPALRRSQAVAATGALGTVVTRYLVTEKLRAQARVLGRIAGSDTARAGITEAIAEAERVRGSQRLRFAEASGASSYWSAWEHLPIPFARADEAKVPEHWRTFGRRSSPLTHSPRLAANPPNAILNYLYAVLETEARIACLAVGLDPGLGVLHADQRARDSMVLDVMEPARPTADAYVLDLLTSHVFRARDFHETRQGVCRILVPLTHRLAEVAPALGRAVAPIAERVAALLAVERLPTPLTQERRSAGRDGVRTRPTKAREPKAPRPPAACRYCGVILDPGRRVCDDCLADHRRERAFPFADAGPAALARLRAEGRDPTAAPDARSKQGRSMSARNRERDEWDQANLDADRDPETFRQEVLPGLQGVTIRRIVEATGLSLRHCARIRRGEVVPHPRHWSALRALARE